MNPIKKAIRFRIALIFGGAEENRTLDLLNAIQALSQLSYGPTSEGVGNITKLGRQ